MDELRVVRREDQSLIVANETGEEFRLLVDSGALAELRHLARQLSGSSRVNPRQIQSLVRAGKTRAEIIELTGADDNDIERYEEPVLAERRFILSTAQSIAVRTSPAEQSEQQFGTVIAERLIGLNAKNIEWSSWRDEEAGWMIGLEFDSYDVSHRAVWSFEHRKSILSPITPDATNLSKQGDVGERLIPKLRAVDTTDGIDRFDSGAFDHEQLLPEGRDLDEVGDSLDTVDSERSSASSMSAGAEAAVRAGHPSTGSIPIVDADAEFARRREIDQRAISSPEAELPDLGQTADLLDALRRRRGEREETAAEAPEPQPEPPNPVPIRGNDAHSASGFAAPRAVEPVPEAPQADTATVTPAEPESASEHAAEPPKRSRGRTSIPSWDDILFGTRSEEDPN